MAEIYNDAQNYGITSVGGFVLKKIIYLINVFLLVGPLAAFAVDPYVCPTVDQVKNNLVNEINPYASHGWLLGSPPFSIPGSDPYTGVSLQMYDGNLTQISVLDFAQKLQQTATTVVEYVVFTEDPFKHAGSYFWVCSYDLDPRSVYAGDTVFVFSKNYDFNGKISKINLSTAKKLAIVQQDKLNKR